MNTSCKLQKNEYLSGLETPQLGNPQCPQYLLFRKRACSDAQHLAVYQISVHLHNLNILYWSSANLDFLSKAIRWQMSRFYSRQLRRNVSMTTSMQVKATRSDQVPPSTPSIPSLLSPCSQSIFLPQVRMEFVLTVLAFNGTFVPRKSICLPGSYAASCQLWKD